MPIKFKKTSDFKQTKKYLNGSIDITKLDFKELEKICDNTIKNLYAASPSESIAKQWTYEIVKEKNSVTIFFNLPKAILMELITSPNSSLFLETMEVLKSNCSRFLECCAISFNGFVVNLLMTFAITTPNIIKTADNNIILFFIFVIIEYVESVFITIPKFH